MGFFKKIFKPVSKVLNKVIPNEIKPLLPYAAAFAPYLLPAGAGLGALGGSMSPMLQRAILTGGLNLGSQLSQEGSEGDFNMLSTLLSGAQGALTAPGAADSLSNMKISGRAPDGTLMRAGKFSGLDLEEQLASGLTSDIGMLGKAQNFGLEGLIKGANLSEKASNALSKPGFNMATAKAAAVPFTMGTGDAMYAEGNRAMKDYQRALLDYESSLAEGEFATDEGRRSAIIAAMTAGKHTQSVIDSTLSELGLKDGGRVGKMNGGIMNAKRGLVDAPGGYAGIEKEEVEFGGITEAVKNVNEDKQRAYMELLDTASIDREADLRMERLNNLIEQGMSEDEAFKLVMPNAFSNDGKTDSEGRPIEVEEIKDYSKYKDIPIGIGNIKTGNVVEMYDNFKNRPDMLTLENVKNIPANLKNAGKEIYNAAGEVKNEVVDEYKMYKLYFNLSEKDKKEMKEMGFNDLFEVKDYITMRDSKAKGGIIGLNMGGSVLPQGMEMDYRGGGFIPMGSKERADDVPARVSKNEFVMTADAVKAAGGGSVNQGAKRMYDLMNNLEARV